jgi:hypothetical protein
LEIGRRERSEVFGDASKMLRSGLRRFVIHRSTTFRPPHIPSTVMEIPSFDRLWQNRVNAPNLALSYPLSGVLLCMNDDIAFLLDVAEQLREIALTEPAVAADLRRLAEDIEATAVELRRDRRPGPRASEPEYPL